MKPVFVPFALHNLFVGPDDQGVTVFKGGLEVIFQPIKASASQGLVFLWHSIELFSCRGRQDFSRR